MLGGEHHRHLVGAAQIHEIDHLALRDTVITIRQNAWALSIMTSTGPSMSRSHNPSLSWRVDRLREQGLLETRIRKVEAGTRNLYAGTERGHAHPEVVADLPDV